MNHFMATVFGPSSFRVFQKRKLDDAFIYAACPNIPSEQDALWMMCAKNDNDALVSCMSKRDEDVGLVIESFVTKSLLHNVDALRAYSERTGISPAHLAIMCCYRRQAYDTLIEMCITWSRNSKVHATNHRAMRLVVAVAKNERDNVTELLAGHCDASAMYNLPVITAVQKGLYDMTMLLLAQGSVDVSQNHSALLVYAAGQRDRRTFQLILHHPKTDVAQAGPAAAMTAINEALPEHALQIVRHRDWPPESCYGVVDIITDLPSFCEHHVAILRACEERLENGSGKFVSTAKEIMQLHKKLRELRKRIDSDKKAKIDKIEAELLRVTGRKCTNMDWTDKIPCACN